MGFIDVNQKLMIKHGIDPICGCECPQGWFDLVDQLLSELLKIEEFHPSMVSQIKSKFCSLRVYIDGEVPEIDRVNALISEAETKSHQTCELCGALSIDRMPTKIGIRTCAICRDSRFETK